MKHLITNTRKSIIPGIALAILLMGFIGCESGKTKTDTEESGETEEVCSSDDTKLRASISTLTFSCPDGKNCLDEEYDDKFAIVRHEELIIENPTNRRYDPVFTGLHVDENWKEEDETGALECNEPPPRGGGNSLVATSASSSTPLRVETVANSEDADEFAKIFFMTTCQDTSPLDERPFLSASVFEGNYDDLLNRYNVFTPEDGYTPGGEKGHLVTGVNTGNSMRAFRVMTHIGHYVTIVETENSNYVFRFSHNSSDRFENSVQLVE